ncbi:hypothetical protein PGTUg99_028631 [Puccinia graminis f. sp. tritici]|uniref:Uncharacterized protein n=1 Tax=Puccinia graminis f. sp. tritici TaxID=56615 RepID=A0A5B0Q435_PUCGR|nr:hypothetical protein PGTUg99_028631 [Puccinia graminis f. sp. tritici]
MSQGRSSEGMQWGQNPAQKLARFPDHRNLQICRTRKVAPICARSQTDYQRPRKARQSIFTGARRQALLQRCAIALLTFCQSPHESTHVNVSPAKGRQDVVLTPTTPTTSFVVISDRVGTLPPAEGGNVRETLLRGVNRTFSCTGGVHPMIAASWSSGSGPLYIHYTLSKRDDQKNSRPYIY